jgi:hypothetical protein
MHCVVYPVGLITQRSRVQNNTDKHFTTRPRYKNGTSSRASFVFHRFLNRALLCDRCLVVSVLSGMLRKLQVRAARFRRGNLVQPSTANRRWPGWSIPPQYFDPLRRFLQELKSVAVDRDAPFVASRARVSNVVCSFGSTLEQAKDGWKSVTATEATT